MPRISNAHISCLDQLVELCLSEFFVVIGKFVLDPGWEASPEDPDQLFDRHPGVVDVGLVVLIVSERLRISLPLGIGQALRFDNHPVDRPMGLVLVGAHFKLGLREDVTQMFLACLISVLWDGRHDGVLK